VVRLAGRWRRRRTRTLFPRPKNWCDSSVLSSEI
jgi:hypothetical protein